MKIGISARDIFTAKRSIERLALDAKKTGLV